MAMEIKYNGSVIATFEEGQTATIACAGKLMKSDVVVTADSGNVETCSVTFDITCEKSPIVIFYTDASMKLIKKEVKNSLFSGTLDCAKGTSVFIANGIPSNEIQYMNVSGNIEGPYNNWPFLLINGDGSVYYLY